MPTARKESTVAELTSVLGRSTFTILTDYRGLKVSDLQNLRGQLRQHDAEVRIAKNTLTRIAARANNIDALEGQLTGPTALITAYGDPVQPAKIATDFARTSRILQVRGAILEGALVGPADVEAIGNLPSKEVLVGKVIGGLASPLYGLVGVLSGPARSLAYVLQARIDQLGGAPAEAEAAAEAA